MRDPLLSLPMLKPLMVYSIVGECHCWKLLTLQKGGEEGEWEEGEGEGEVRRAVKRQTIVAQTETYFD